MSVDTDVPPARRSRAPRVVLVAVVAAALGLGIYWLANRDALAARQAEVAERGAEVMPFALEGTTHLFRPTADGGVQTVVADNMADGKQIELIRAHLREAAERFARGDFSDPTAIHGQQMPGLAALREGANAIEVTYADMPDGGRITYVTDDPELADALHHWFDAQLRDHGHDATQG